MVVGGVIVGGVVVGGVVVGGVGVGGVVVGGDTVVVGVWFLHSCDLRNLFVAIMLGNLMSVFVNIVKTDSLSPMYTLYL